MSDGAAATTPICPCDVFVHPRRLFNPPGLSEIDYLIGDFGDFRRALLAALPGEVGLAGWRPSATADLAMQMVEWWAYLADILALYSERAANESYLRTADLPESVDRLIRTLGYRPRPGIAARGSVAALTSGKKGLTVPAGFQVQSKPGPGKQPQTFEVDAKTTIAVPAAVDVDLPGDDSLVPSGADPGALLAGSITSVKAGDELLVLTSSWSPSGGWALTTAKEVRHVKDPRGKPQTLIVFADALPSLTDPLASDSRLLAGPSTAHLWPHSTDPGVVFRPDAVDLDAVVRRIATGDPILFERSDDPIALLLQRVASVTEPIWYANGLKSDPSQTGTPPANVPLIPIPHTRVGFAAPLRGAVRSTRGGRSVMRLGALVQASSWDQNKQFVQVRCGWRELGPLLARPRTTLSGQTEATLAPVAGEVLPLGVGGRQVLIEDGSGGGASGAAEQGGTTTQLAVDDLTDSAGLTPALTAPLRALFDVLPVSRGQTVTGEVLGSGDAAQPGQEFTLQKSPLTYLQSGGGYASTLVVRVDGVAWTEVPSLYGQRADAQVFVTREDQQGKTHVTFGDGKEGARLPSGVGNVVADYRYGSGKDAPDAGTLTVIAKPLPGLKAVRNPVAVGGGADPDPPSQIRRYAPRSVLTFGRAISADDYETTAAQAPGVDRARAYWSWDSSEQRALVTVYVGDTGAAVSAARTALAGADDPNRPLLVQLATAVPVRMSLRVEVDPARVTATVLAAVRAALDDPDTGLFGLSRVRIGAGFYRSEVYDACLAVPGAIAVHRLTVYTYRFGVWWRRLSDPGPRYAPGEGRYFQLPSGGVTVTEEVTAGAA
jgi:hypothetical protein